MSTASEILSAIASRFDGAANRALFLQMAESRTSSTYYGPNRSDAVALRAAHLLAVNEAANASDGESLGPVASKSEGDLSVSYGKIGNGGGVDYDLSSTSYGRQLIGIRRSSGTGIRTTGVPFVLGSGY